MPPAEREPTALEPAFVALTVAVSLLSELPVRADPPPLPSLGVSAWSDEPAAPCAAGSVADRCSSLPGNWRESGVDSALASRGSSDCNPGFDGDGSISGHASAV